MVIMPARRTPYRAATRPPRVRFEFPTAQVNIAVHQLPNLITVLRFLLIAPVGLCVLADRSGWAFLLFVSAGISDGVDGWLARRFAWTSRFGAIADPLADKLLMGVAYVALTVQGVLPVWLTALVLGRDLLIVGGALCYHFLIEPLEMMPTVLGKVTTVAQVLFIGTVLASLTATPLAALAPWVPVLTWVMAVLTLLSALDYVRIWSARALHQRPREVADDAGGD